MSERLSVGINGAGRFGLHLLQYWIEHHDTALFTIDYLNDSLLTAEDLATIVRDDKYLRLRNYVTLQEDSIIVQLPSQTHSIALSRAEVMDIPWLGDPDHFLECSGKHTDDEELVDVAIGNTTKVIVSATSWTAGEILVYGYNHTKHQNTPVVSYGSCTVNAYIPLAHEIDRRFGVVDSDVNIIHNVPAHHLSDFYTLERKLCTLQVVAPHLLDFIHNDNFLVNYSLVPYDGVSMIDFRFRLKRPFDANKVLPALVDEIENGSLKSLYKLVQADTGPEAHKFTEFSAVIVKPSLLLKGDNLYFQAYFDNENSVNRYFDLVNYFSTGGLE